MPQFVIERDVPGVHKLTDSEIRAVAQKSVEALTSLGPQIQWVQSYVTENKIYCVYMAPDEATIREHAQARGRPRRPRGRGASAALGDRRRAEQLSAPGKAPQARGPRA